jgi:hypothetical protein
MSIETPIAIAVEVFCIAICIWGAIAVLGLIYETFSGGDGDR